MDNFVRNDLIYTIIDDLPRRDYTQNTEFRKEKLLIYCEEKAVSVPYVILLY
jgi:hypothetical protein